MKVFDKKTIISMIITLLVLTGFFLFNSVSYAKPNNVPEITSFEQSSIQSNSLKLVWESKGADTIEVLNTTTKRHYRFGGATGYTFQGLVNGKSYEVIIRACDRVNNLYDCTNWSPVKSATAKELNNSNNNNNNTNYTASSFSLSPTSFTYDGAAKRPRVTIKNTSGTVLKEGTDYKVEYKNNVNVGTGTCLVTGLGNYKFSKTLTFKINSASIKSVTLSSSNYTYNGKVKTPSVTVMNNKSAKLVNGRDYSVIYQSGRVKIGTYRVRIIGKGNYKFDKSLYFKISGSDILSSTISNIDSKYAFKSKAVKPNPKVTFKGKKLTKDKDYKVTYQSNKSPGTAYVIIKGKGSYTGSKKKSFKIYISDRSTINTKSTSGDGYSRKITLSGRTYKLYKQGSGSYRNDRFSPDHVKMGGTIHGNGCGPSSIATVLSGYGYSYDPGQVGRKLRDTAKEYGYSYPASYKTRKKFFEKLGFEAINHNNRNSYDRNYKEMKEALLSGHQVVLFVGKGGKSSAWHNFTSSGYHFISVLGIDPTNNKVFVGNSNSIGPGWYNLSTVVKARGSKFSNGSGPSVNYLSWTEVWKPL